MRRSNTTLLKLPNIRSASSISKIFQIILNLSNNFSFYLVCANWKNCSFFPPLFISFFSSSSSSSSKGKYNTLMIFPVDMWNDNHLHIFILRSCFSPVGKKGSRQDIILGDGCWDRGIVAHEIGNVS